MPTLFILLLVVLLTAALLIVLIRILQRKRTKNTFAVYASELKSFQLPTEGRVEYAQWLHPSEGPKEIKQEDVDELRRFIKKGDMVIDIGSHTGDTTVPMALAAGASGCTLGLEPNPYVFKILEQNASLNKEKTNITPLNIAATDTDGTFTFHYSDASYCNGGFLSQIENQTHRHRYPLEVHGRNLNKLLREEYASWLNKLSYIKIDTEGYDKHIIESIMSILKEYRPVVKCEVLKKLTRPEREALFDSLIAAGYVCHKVNSEDDLKGELIERDAIEKWRQFDLLAIPKPSAPKSKKASAT